MKGKIVFVPIGGLANRMRATASVAMLAMESRNDLRIFWFRDWALHAPFYALFEPVSIDGLRLEIKEASPIDLLLFDRPRKRNVHLPALFQQLLFRYRIYENDLGEKMKNNFDFLQWATRDGAKYLASCYPFHPYSENLIRKLFRPQPEIKAEIENRCAEFSPYTVGVHVRRTDNLRSIEESPLQLFFDALDKEAETHPELGIYLATDSEEVKNDMTKRYGKRVMFCLNKADRNTVSGIKDGIADMYTLSHTRKIFGSYYSSFSELAAELGGVPLEIIRKP